MKKFGLTFFVSCVGLIILFVINPFGFKEKLFFKNRTKEFKTNNKASLTENSTSRRLNRKLSVANIPIEDYGGELSAIVDKLQESGSGKTFRIAYFGDSIIEGDLISSTLRKLLQNHYGNGGAGLLQVAPDNSGFVDGITHSYSNSWKKYSILQAKPGNFPFGISGYSFKTNDDSISTNEYQSINLDFHQRGFKTARILYLNPNSDSKIRISENPETVTEAILPKSSTVSEFNVMIEKKKRLKLEFEPNSELCLFGISLETEGGVIIDNFALRGHSGLLLKKIDVTVLSQFNNLLNYDLIVLQYGANVSDESVKDFGWYESGMSSVVRHLKRGITGCPVLIISATDRAYKDINGFHSAPAISKLVSSQEKAARNTDSAFWNLYMVMGGENSMFSWVEAGLASKDFIHLNHEGAGKVGRMLYNSLINVQN